MQYLGDASLHSFIDHVFRQTGRGDQRFNRNVNHLLIQAVDQLLLQYVHLLLVRGQFLLHKDELVLSGDVGQVALYNKVSF